MSNEQKYYELLTRTDHPVFLKYFNETVVGSPFNSIVNRVLAKQINALKSDIDEVVLNSFPDTVTDLSIDQWEYTYFGFVKNNALLSERINSLLLKINNKIGMSVNDVITIARAITGVTPTVIRSIYYSGWALDEAPLDINTILSGLSAEIDAQTYIISFDHSIDSFLLSKLDEELTKIEKAGSVHKLISPINFWVLDDNTLDIDAIVG